MAKRTSIATFKRWWRNTRTQSSRAVSSRLRLLLRPLLRAVQQPQNSRSGFVLPTAALLLLVVSLVIGAVLLRTINRTEQVIGIREEKVIYNAATPAIDRAKAKIEYMFAEDPRLPAGVPSQERLLAMMLNDGSEDTPALPNLESLYKLEDEDRIPINGQKAPAWAYRIDSDGDGQEDLTIAYSITYQIPNDLAALSNTKETAIRQRAKNLQVRNGPVSGIQKAGCPTLQLGIEEGWLKDPLSTAILRKNFQIDAFAISDKENGTVVALEMQQDRQANRGNKWGAWFRNDLEIFPGPPLRWNGAMRTDGSVFVGRDPAPRNDRQHSRYYLVSGTDSCIAAAGKENSIVSLGAPPSNEDYQGQMVSALLNVDRYQGAASFHFERDGNPVQELDATRISPETDSVKDGVADPSELALDPILLFTEDKSAYRGQGLTADRVRDAGTWSNGAFTEEGRVTNEPIEKPLVDDFYRADDRYGPKPGYGTKVEDTLIEKGTNSGDPITGEPRFTTLNPVGDGIGNAKEMGLDGYWERRAWREGMRVITGQRLELGNDPLPDPVGYAAAGLQIPIVNRNNLRREHEAIQRRGLRDNPAAVQATAIYHHRGQDEDLPVAALATTVHPGTAETLKRSAIFDTPIQFGTSGTGGGFNGTFGDNPEEIAVDFFTGRGTNGWEFNVPNGFFTNAEVTNALENLANFAGDPDGAFPPLQQAGVIHPYPELTKWGNFSNLRRTLDDDLDSIADQTNKHTAALTLGMLAYNLKYLEAYNYGNAVVNGDKIDNRNGTPPDLDNALQQALTDPRDPAAPVGTAEEGLPLGATPEDYIAAIGNLDAAAEPEENENLARLLYLKEQTKRDRTYGFRASPTTGGFRYEMQFVDAGGANDESFTYGGFKYNKSAPDNKPTRPQAGAPQVIDTKAAYFNCDFSTATGNNFFGFGNPSAAPTAANSLNAEKRFLRLATAICGVNEDNDGNGILNVLGTQTEDLNDNGLLDSVKYPSLFYLFPIQAHNHLASGTIAQPQITTGIDPADRYLTDAYVQRVNASAQYQAIDLNTFPILKPKPIDQWILPNVDVNPATACRNDHAVDAPNPNCSQFNVVWDGINDKGYRVAFKDTGLFNGREMMNVRALNLDLELLKDETIGGDTWIAGGNSTGDPTSTTDKDGGLVYAFREDAVREDAIARPNGGAWAACNTVRNIITPRCRTNVVQGSDPPVNVANGISPKPVDFYADPDRRPHGFRLINGADISRDAVGGAIEYGLTFISDNPAYLQGNFNCHGSCDNPQEESSQPLAEDYSNFYTRRFNERDYRRFANPDVDSWRSSEILVDALTLLSENFCDGSIEDGFLTAGDRNLQSGLRTRLGTSANGIGRNPAPSPNMGLIYGCQNPGESNTSYLNQNRPSTPPPAATAPTLPAFNNWLRENPADPASPIRISPNGNPLLASGDDYQGDYYDFQDGVNVGNQPIKPLVQANPLRVNAMIVSGTVPSQAYQSAGGLHNFPRFIERWDGTNLNLSGSMLQLNFSTYASSPWDPDAWEPGRNPIPEDQFTYYYPPNRLWGYDVGLQLAPPGPLATRLISLSKNRSEYYRELPLDDPYITNLRCSSVNGKAIDPRAAASGDCS